MSTRNDIYDYSYKLEVAKEKLKSAPISDKNKGLIEGFDNACFIEGLSKPRRLKLISTLIIIAEDYK